MQSLEAKALPCVLRLPVTHRAFGLSCATATITYVRSGECANGAVRQHKMVIIVTIEAAQGCETLRGNAENGFCRRLATAIHGSRANNAITCIQPPLNKKGGICDHANVPITGCEEANLQNAIILRTPRVNTPSGASRRTMAKTVSKTIQKVR